MTITITLLVSINTGCLSDQSQHFKGTVLNQGAAYNFSLTNHRGESVSLEHYKGRLVLLTFLFTHCADICPVTANQVYETSLMLDKHKIDLAIIVITVDPERDTVLTAQAYLKNQDLDDEWEFLVGTREDLLPVWRHYYLDPVSLAGGSGSQSMIQESFEKEYRIVHSAPVYLIDKNGMMRMVYTWPFNAKTLANDIKSLAAEVEVPMNKH